jgi:hypothetical protein
MDLDPELQYKKHFVLPGGFIPGPNKPGMVETFLIPGFQHVSTLQKEGLKCWDGQQSWFIRSCPFFFAATADTKGLPMINGLVGHSGKHGCRLYCGFPGHHKPGAPMYYPAVLKPTNHKADKHHHPNIAIESIGPLNVYEYNKNLQTLLQVPMKTKYKETWLEMGISRPTICLGLRHVMLPMLKCFPQDLMHLCSLNIPNHLLSIWCNMSDPKINFLIKNKKPSFIVLDNSTTWKAHSTLVASTKRFLPTCFGHPPCNPALKINSGYKACKFMIYFWILGPAIFCLVLPHHLWRNFCKLVQATQIVHQCIIMREQLENAHDLLLDWELEFEQEYYGHDIRHLHFIHPCIHAMVHVAQETVWCGPLHPLAQWALENTIGNLGREIRQPSNPFSNLAKRGLLRAQQIAVKALLPDLVPPFSLPQGAKALGQGFTLLTAKQRSSSPMGSDAEIIALRSYVQAKLQDPEFMFDSTLLIQKWAHLLLPNGQAVRSAWKDGRKDCGQNSHNVKVTNQLRIFHVPHAITLGPT